MLACHAGGRGFESRPLRHLSTKAPERALSFWAFRIVRPAAARAPKRLNCAATSRHTANAAETPRQNLRLDRLVILGLLIIPFAFFGVEHYMSAAHEDLGREGRRPRRRGGRRADSGRSPSVDAKKSASRDFRERFERARQQQRQQQGEDFDAARLRDARRTSASARPADRRARAGAGRRARRRRGRATRGRRSASWRCRRSRSTASSIPSSTSSRSRRRTCTAAAFEKRCATSLQSNAAAARQLGDRRSSATPSSTPAQAARRRRATCASCSCRRRRRTPAAAGRAEIDRPGTTRIAASTARRRQVAIEYVEIDAAALAGAAGRRSDAAPALRTGKGRLRQRSSSAWPRTSWSRCRPNADAAAQTGRRSEGREARRAGARRRAPTSPRSRAANSDDVGSKDAGRRPGLGREGRVRRSRSTTPLFAMQAGAGQRPGASTEFGWHVIQVRELKVAGSAKPFEEVRADSRPSRPKPSASAPSTTSPASSSTWSTRIRPRSRRPRGAGAAGADARPVLARRRRRHRRAIRAVQRPRSPTRRCQDGLVSDPIEIAPNHVVVLRVTQHKPARALPLAQVRDRIVAAIRADRAPRPRRRSPTRMVARAQGGETLDAVAAEQRPGRRRRCRTCRAARRSRDRAAGRQAYFAVPAPAAGKVSPGSVALGRRQLRGVRGDEGDRRAIWPKATPADTRASCSSQLAQIARRGRGARLHRGAAQADAR